MYTHNLTDAINELIDEDIIEQTPFGMRWSPFAAAGIDNTPGTPFLYPKDIARRAIERCGAQDEASLEDVETEVRGTLLYREAILILKDGQEGGESITEILPRVRRAFQRQTGLSEAAVDPIIEGHLSRLLAECSTF